MSVDILKLKELATAAKRDQYDNLALNDYGMAMAPAVTLEPIAEIERHRQVDVEGCRPDNRMLLSGPPCSDAASCLSLDKAEGGTPNLSYNEWLAQAAARHMLERGAENYIGEVYTITLPHGEQAFEILVTTQRVGAKTAHDLRQVAESDNKTLQAKLDQRDALLDRLRNHLIAKGVLSGFGPELFQILNIEVPERKARRV